MLFRLNCLVPIHIYYFNLIQEHDIIILTNDCLDTRGYIITCEIEFSEYEIIERRTNFELETSSKMHDHH